MSKLLNINNYHYPRGGSDVVYFRHAEIFGEMGWNNAYFSMHHPKNVQSEWSQYFVDELELGHQYSLWKKVLMAGKVVYSFEAQRKLNKLLDQFKPDVAHLHCIYHHLSPSILPVLKARGVPVVMTAHDLKLACPAYLMLNKTGICEQCSDGNVLNVIKNKCIKGSTLASTIVGMEAWVNQQLNTWHDNLDAVVVPSKFYIEKFVQWGMPRSRFHYVPNFVESRLFEPNYDAGDYFLYFGRLSWEKGVPTLIRAAAKAGIKLKLAGTGPEDAQLRQLAADLGADAEFMGFCAGEKLHGLIKNARAVILPSEWYENAPMSVLESFALGKPVIGAEIGGIPELLRPGISGWTYASGDVDALAARIEEVAGLGNAQLRDMGMQSRRMVETEFSKQRYSEGVRDVYTSLGVMN